MNRLFLALISLTLIGTIVLPSGSCTKNTTTIVTKIDTVAPKVCDVRGTYIGTSLTNGVTNPCSYQLEDDNFAVGFGAGNAKVTFGSYSNTCDSVIIFAYYTTTSSYFILQGKLLNNGTTISGSYQDITNDISGTFTMSK